MDWFFIALIPPALYALTNLLDVVLIRRVVRDVKMGALIVFTGVAYAGLLGVSWYAAGATVFSVPFQSAMLAIAAGIFWVIFLIPYYRMMAVHEPDIVVPFFAFIPIYLAIAGTIFLGEYIDALGYAGIFLVFTGVIGASLERWSLFFRAPFSLWAEMSMASLSITAGIIAFKMAGELLSYWQSSFYMALGGIGTVVFLFVLRPLYVGQVVEVIGRVPRLYLAINIVNEVVDQTAGAVLRYALLLGPAAVVQAINVGVQPLYMLVGWAILAPLGGFYGNRKMRVTFRRFAYLGLAAGGVILVYMHTFAGAW